MSEKEAGPKKSKRRAFIKAVLVLAGLSVVGAYTLNTYLASERGGETKISKTKITNINNVPKGEAYTFNIPYSDVDQADSTGPCLLIHLPNGELRAYSAVCTHLGCTVKYIKEDNIIACPCHNGKYDPQSGEVISGPPPRPLPQINLMVETNGDVYAVGVTRKSV